MKCLHIFIQTILLICTLIPGSRNEILHSLDLLVKDCKVTEPLYNVTFDLNSLRSDLNHQVKGEGDEIIEFNVCGDMLKTCNGKSHVSACHRNGDKEHILGVGSELKLMNGRFHFNFTGDKCKDNINYSLQVLLRCEYNYVKDPIKVMPHPNDVCEFFITWETQLACQPLPAALESNDCTVKDESNGDIFDLLPLSQYNHKISDRNDSFFIINICKPILYQLDEMCPPGSSICYKKSSEPDLRKRFYNYGTTVPNPTYDHKRLSMVFTSNEKCETSTISSLINFVCDSTTDGEPEFVGKIGCQYQFLWATKYACKSFQMCTVIDPITEFVYDFRSLSKDEHKIVNGNNTYFFGICNKASKSCPGNVGACKVNGNQTSGLGLFNDNLRFNGTGAPYLIYKGGAVCDSLSHQWTTKIEFLCKTSGLQEGLKLIENEQCQIVIQYVTELACQKQIECKAYNWTDGSTIDLTSLINVEKNYEAILSDAMKAKDDPSMVYYINVCRPLVPQFGLSCPGSSAVCRAKKGVTTPINEQSLGFPDVSLTIVNTSNGFRPQMKYLRGSVCPTYPNITLSSVIEFYCDVKAGKGLPILQDIEDGCHYKFDWPTNVICPKHNCEYRESKCEIFNDQSDIAISLKSFTDDSNGNINVNHSTGSFKINVCGSDKKTVETDYAEGVVAIFFTVPGTCNNNDKINVDLRLVCKSSELNITSLNKDSCDVVLVKETPNICNFIGIANTEKDGFSFKPLTVTSISDDTVSGGISAMGALLLAAALVFVVIANVYIFKSPERRAKIKSICSRRTVAVQYTRVRSDEEANLLLSQPDRLSDSDDELLV